MLTKKVHMIFAEFIGLIMIKIMFKWSMTREQLFKMATGIMQSIIAL